MNGAAYDPKNTYGGDVSLAKGQNVAATLTGDYIDCDKLQGPVVCPVMTGVAAGTPDSFTATFTLLEADSSGGSGSQAIPIQSDAVVLTADKGLGYLTGRRTKRYVAVKCVLAFVNGTTPKQDVFGLVQGQGIHSPVT